MAVKEPHEVVGANKVLVAVVLAAFTVLNVYVFVVDGQLTGLVQWVGTLKGWGLVLVADLVISLSLAGTWLYRDARRRGASSLPYLLLTATTGSIGPLLYLLRRKG